jgi:hypothetical protein
VKDPRLLSASTLYSTLVVIAHRQAIESELLGGHIAALTSAEKSLRHMAWGVINHATTFIMPDGETVYVVSPLYMERLGVVLEQHEQDTAQS